jgi:hypothetical protein
MAEAAAVAVLDAVVSEEARAMLADFLPLLQVVQLQVVQLQEEIVRELNQQLLQSKQRLTATQYESSRAHEELRAQPPICGASFSESCWSTRKLCAASISS